MNIVACLRNYPSGLASFWLLIPKWLRRLPRPCQDCGGTNFLLAKTRGAPPWSSVDRARRIERLMAESLLEGFRSGAVRR